MKKIYKLCILIAMVFIVSTVVMMVGCTNPSTPAGHEGYVKENPRVWGEGGFVGELKGPKNYGVSMWRNEVENVDFRPQTFAEKFKILTKDELNLTLNFQTIIKIKPNTIKTVVEEYAGSSFYLRYIKEPFRSMVRTHVQPLESCKVKEERKEIAKLVMNDLTKYLANTPFTVLSCVVGNIKYPDAITKAVDAKLAAKQLLDEKETQRYIAKKDAEIRVEKAKGIAEAQRIINSTLTPNYLQHEAISAQREMAKSPNHTTVYVPCGSNGIPLVKILK